MDWKAFAANAGTIAGPAWSSRRVAAVSIVGSWTLYFAFVAARLAILSFPRELLLLQRHLLTITVGAGLTTVLYLLLRRLEHAPIALRIGAALLLAMPAAGLLSCLNYEFLYVIASDALWSGLPHGVRTLRGIFARTILEIYLVFAGWAALYISVTSAVESQQAQRRAAVSQAETRDAQLRALRYQLNPHFLFNALNTVSALVLRSDTEAAEDTIQALSLFLRSALVEDALEDTTLGEEVDIQHLYLGIEQARFGDRLRVHWSVPDAVRGALLPSLLLQPLVENVIRHAVAPAREPVTMEIAASVKNGRLHLSVQDDGRGGSAPSGHGIGLRNTQLRLATRYGDAARCLHGARPGGGFRVELVLPLRLKAEKS